VTVDLTWCSSLVDALVQCNTNLECKRGPGDGNAALSPGRNDVDGGVLMLCAV